MRKIEERKARQPLPLHLPAAFITPAGSLQSVTESISANGLYCFLPDVLSVDQVVECTVTMSRGHPGDQVLIHCSCRVMRVEAVADSALRGVAFEILEYRIETVHNPGSEDD